MIRYIHVYQVVQEIVVQVQDKPGLDEDECLGIALNAVQAQLPHDAVKHVEYKPVPTCHFIGIDAT